MLGSNTRVGHFVVPVGLEADGVRFGPVPAKFRHDARDGGTVQAATEERANASAFG